MARLHRRVNNKKNEKKKKEKKVEKVKKYKSPKIDFGYNYFTIGEIEKMMVPSSNKKIPEITKLEDEVLKAIVGQDEQVRRIITAVYRARNFDSIKSNILIIGNSGTGKTETVKQIAKHLNLPYTIEDATDFSKVGYYGADVEDMVYDLIKKAGNDVQRAMKGIIVVDEIDKKAKSSSVEDNDVSGVEVLKSLLKLIEGTELLIDMSAFYNMQELKQMIETGETEELDTAEFDTKDLIFIFMGAFPGLEQIREKRLNVKPLGFANNPVKSIGPKEKGFTKDDLIKYGMTEEFMGRIDTIVEMNKLTVEDLVKILTKSNLSIFSRYKSELAKKGVTLEYEDEIFESIAKEALSYNTGARELSNIVNYMFEKITYEVLAKPDKYSQCKLLPDIVKDNTQFVLS